MGDFPRTTLRNQFSLKSLGEMESKSEDKEIVRMKQLWLQHSRGNLYSRSGTNSPLSASTSRAASKSASTSSDCRDIDTPTIEEQEINLKISSAFASSPSPSAKISTAVCFAPIDESDRDQSRPQDEFVPPGTGWAWKRSIHLCSAPLKMFSVGFMEGLRLAPLGARMYLHVRSERKSGKLPIMDPFSSPAGMLLPDMGVPCGGIGSGSINRGYRGSFQRWQLRPGLPNYKPIDANQFIVRSKTLKPESSYTPEHDLVCRVLNTSYKNFKHPPQSQTNTQTASQHATSSASKREINSMAEFLSDEEGLHNSANLQHSTNNQMGYGKTQSVLRKEWEWGLSSEASTYQALFPRAWTNYERDPDPALRLTCMQISPVIPHNYKESSYPVCVFRWNIENLDDEFTKEVSLMLTWANAARLASNSSFTPNHKNRIFRSETKKKKSVVGIELIHHQTQICKGTTHNDPLSFAIATIADESHSVSFEGLWKPSSSSSARSLWNNFKQNGDLTNHEDESPSTGGYAVGAAICVKCIVEPGKTQTVTFAIAWDCPIARFGEGEGYYRRYTRFFGKEGKAAPDIATEALSSCTEWNDLIIKWQMPILLDPSLPDYYKHALFNELYYIVDGGSIWTNGKVDWPDKVVESDDDYIGHFAYLESLEYLMYNTYDVHFYASYALCMLWPKLELSLQRDFAQAVLEEYEDKWTIMHDGKQASRKIKGCVPHDLGCPGESPWNKVNSYNIQDTTRWKDLPSKFVLMIYRDYHITNDRSFLNDVWSACKAVMAYAKQFEGEDGIILNEGFPDQTFDTWTAKGLSAYSGGLYITALAAMSKMSEIMGENEESKKYGEQAEKGRTVYSTKLFKDGYFQYDNSNSGHSDSVMADQLAGQWWARACQLPDLAPEDQIHSALSEVLRLNVKSFNGGKRGAVNGMKKNGIVDTSSLQSSEVWTGVTYGVAATMIHMNMIPEAFQTAAGLIYTTYLEYGYQFQTPEAYDVNGRFRALCYMRGLAIWAMQYAIEAIRKDEKTSNVMLKKLRYVHGSQFFRSSQGIHIEEDEENEDNDSDDLGNDDLQDEVQQEDNVVFTAVDVGPSSAKVNSKKKQSVKVVTMEELHRICTSEKTE